jgi:hypothetical protein
VAAVPHVEVPRGGMDMEQMSYGHDENDRGQHTAGVTHEDPCQYGYYMIAFGRHVYAAPFLRYCLPQSIVAPGNAKEIPLNL